MLLIVYGDETTVFWVGGRFSCRVAAVLCQLASAPEDGHQPTLFISSYVDFVQLL